MKIVEFILDKILKNYEKQISGYDYSKYKYVDFILFLFNQLAEQFTIKELVELIYTEPHKYNKHPFLYSGVFSHTKMLTFLLNKDEAYLKWLIKELINYDGKKENK